MEKAVAVVKMVVQSSEPKYGSHDVHLSCQYDTSIPEDKRFFDATPSGEMAILVNNPRVVEALKPGQAYHLYLVPVE